MNEADCPLRKEETADLWLDYSAKRLDAAGVAMLERHGENCLECSKFRMEQTVVWDALDRWEPMPVSMDFNRRLWRRIDAAANAPWYRSLADSLRFANWKAVFPLAATILVIAGGFLLDHPRNSAPGNRAPGNRAAASIEGVSVTQADQLEQTLDDIQMLRQLDGANTPNGGSSKRM